MVGGSRSVGSGWRHSVVMGARRATGRRRNPMADLFSTWRLDTTAAKPRLAEILDLLTDGEVPIRFVAYDGSATGPTDAEITVSLRTPRGAAYLATAPGSLGLARAYVAGDLQVEGVHPGDPYRLLALMDSDL